MLRARPLIGFLAALGALLSACDTAPPEPTPVRLDLRDALYDGRWGSESPLPEGATRPSCPDEEDRHSFPLRGSIEVDDEEFSLSYTFQDAQVSDGAVDSVRWSGTVERFDGLARFTVSDGRTLYGTLGPDPDRPTTITVLNYGEGPCRALRFGADATDVRGGQSVAESVGLSSVGSPRTGLTDAPWFPVPFYAGGGRGVSFYIQGGQIELSSAGRFVSRFISRQVTSGNVPHDTEITIFGTYRASGPLIVFNPGAPTASFGLVSDAGITVFAGDAFSPEARPRDQYAYRYTR